MNKYPQPCCHLKAQDHCSLLEIKQIDGNNSCGNCNYSGPNLWICIYRKCMHIGCSEQANDHSTQHFQRSRDEELHCIHMNLSSQRAWCYLCEREIGTTAQVVDPMLRSMRCSDDEFVPDVAGGNYVMGTGLVGFQNIANTCYMNSALQALSNVFPMTHYFINCSELVDFTLEQSSHRSKAGLAKSYQRLMRDVWRRRDDEGKAYLAPRSILYGIRSVHPMFRGFQQHDTQEFLRCFMDQLHEELKDQSANGVVSVTARTAADDDETHSSLSSNTASTNSMGTSYVTCDSSNNSEQSSLCDEPISKTKTSGIATAQHTSKTTPSSTSSTTRSIVSDIFDGQLLSSVKCLTCDRVSTKEETFQDLSLPIPNRDFLTVLHQSNSMSVQSLNSIDTTTSSGSISRANDGWMSWIWSIIRSWLWGPSVTLHDCMASFFSEDELKGDNMYSCEKCNKLRTGVKFSRILNLPELLCIHLKRFRHDLSYSSKISSHVDFPLENFDMGPFLHKDCNSQVSLYNLSSVICHHGTVGGGHYTCFARNTFTDRWYEFDDHHVNEVPTDVVQNCQAYVLFYSKSNPQMELIRFEANQLDCSYPVSQSDIRFYISREWYSRFTTFAEPGPISNWSILCPHGGIQHSKSALISYMAIPISQQLWEFLYGKFGGGPAINMLFDCDTCKRTAEALARRQQYEHSVFQRYNDLEAELDSGAIFAISMNWIKKWQLFARGLTSKEPGPINNSSIVNSNSIDASGNGATKISPVHRNVRIGSDYVQLNAPSWRFLHDIYGGGPEVLLRPALEIEIIDQDELDESEGINGNISDTESNFGATNNSFTATTQYNHNISHNGERPKTEATGFDEDINSPITQHNKRKDSYTTQNNQPNSITKRSKNKKHYHGQQFGLQGSYVTKDHDEHSKNDDTADNQTEVPQTATLKKHSNPKSHKSFRQRSGSNPATTENSNNTEVFDLHSSRNNKRANKSKNSVILKKFQSLTDTASATSANQSNV